MPPIFAEYREERLPVRFGDRLRWRWTDLCRVVADVVIAGQVTARDGKRIVQRLGEFEIVPICRAVEREIAAVDDEVGTLRIDVLAQPMKIVRQLRLTAGKMGIGNLRQAKFGHE
jgi:hypothetical protein